MSNSKTSSNTSASCSLLKKLEVRHFGNLLNRVHLRISNVCYIYISERKYKVRVVIFLDRNKHFGNKFIVFFLNYSFLFIDPPVSVLEDRNVMQRHRMCK